MICILQVIIKFRNTLPNKPCFPEYITMTDKHRILYIVSTFCRYEGEMQNPWMLDNLRRLRDRGYKVDILAPSYQGLKTHDIEGFKVYRFRYFFKKWESLTHDQGAPNKIRNSKLYKFMFFPYVLLGMIAAFRLGLKNKYDFVQCHWPFPQGIMGLACIMAKRKAKPTFVLHFYGASLLLAQTYSYVKTVLHYLIRKADLIVCISEFTSRKVKDIKDTTTHIIPYGSPLEYKPVALPNNSTKQILSVGRIIERKGLKYLIQAMPEILEKCDAILNIVGSGDPPVISDLKLEIQKLNLDKRVILTGKLSNEALIQKYKRCDVFCLPAIIDSKGDTEGLGVVILEALNYGRPVVSSNVGGITDIIKHEHTGLLTEQKNPIDLSEKLLTILLDSDKASKLAKQGCEYAKSQFSWEKIMDQWDDFYTQNNEG